LILTVKYCTRCGITKSAAEFHKRTGRPNGLQTACIPCKRAERAAAKKPRVQRSRQTREERREYDAGYYAANREKKLAASAAWREQNKPSIYARNRTRRAALRGCSGSHTAQDITVLFKRQKGRCAHLWCRANLKKSRHIDHVIPLSLGGSNDRKNIQLLCGPCNLGKKAKHPIDFAQQNGMLL
jgi:5-methylcytosine-specific restriction endonuclease McrA